MTLFRKIFLPVLAASVLGLAASGVINYLAARDLVHSTRLLFGQSTAQELTRGLGLVSLQIQRQMEEFAASPAVARLLHPRQDLDREEQERIREHLVHAAHALESVQTFALVDAEGRVAATSERLGKGTLRADRLYFKEALQGRRAEQGPLVGRSSGQPVYVLAQPVAEDGRILGAVMAAVGLEYLNKTLVDPVRVGHDGYMFVLSPSGQVIMHPDRHAVFAADWFTPGQLATIKRQKKGVLDYRQADGTPMLASFVTLPYPGWIVIAEDKRESALKSVANLRRISLWVNGLTLLTVLAFISFVLLGMLRDLKKEAEFARAVSNGDLERTLDIRRKDEIGVLGRTLSHMVGKLKEQIRLSARRREEAERAATELSSVINGIDGGVAKIRLDRPYAVLWANDGFYQLHGCDRDNFADYAVQPGVLLDSVDEDRFFAALREGECADGPVRLDYRIRKADGSTAWLGGRAVFMGREQGRPVFQTVLIDVTEGKLAVAVADVERERYRILSRLSRNIVFEYDMASDTMTYSGQYENLFASGPVVRNFLASLDQRGLTHPDDRSLVRRILSRGELPDPETGVELRLRHAPDEYVWFKAYPALLQNGEREPLKIIGTLTNIQEQKEREEGLRIRAQVDGLTGVLNKSTAESEICKALAEQPEARHALLIADVDDFKKANDLFGHQFGDEVLKEAAGLLRETFRSSDIIGRIGGDEFVVFVRDIRDETGITVRIEQFYERIRRLAVQGEARYVLSVSMGLCLYRGDGHSYGELFRCADAALYRAKEEGKGRFARA